MKSTKNDSYAAAWAEIDTGAKRLPRAMGVADFFLGQTHTQGPAGVRIATGKAGQRTSHHRGSAATWMLLCAILGVVSLHGQPAYAVEGWTKQQRQDTLVYVPKGLKNDQVFRLTFHPPILLNGNENKKRWVIKTSNQRQKGLGTPAAPWNVVLKNKQWGARNRYVDAAGRTMLVINKFDIKGRTVFSYQLIARLDRAADQKLAKRKIGAIERLYSDARATFRRPEHKTKNQPKQATKKPNKPAVEDIREAIRAKPGQGVKPEEIQAIFHSTTTDVVNIGNVVTRRYYLLKDGTLYRHAKIPFYELNAAKSRELEKHNWWLWTKSDKGYRMRATPSDKWRPVPGIAAVAAKKRGRIDRSYIHAGSGGGIGSWYPTSRRSTARFERNGRFRFSNMSMIGSRVKNKSSTGKYHLEGYTLHLNYDSGQQERVFFYFIGKNKTSVNINTTEFWTPKQNK